MGPPVHIPVHNKLLYVRFSFFQWYKDNNVKLKLPAFPKITSMVGFHCEKELFLLILCCITWYMLIMEERETAIEVDVVFIHVDILISL